MAGGLIQLLSNDRIIVYHETACEVAALHGDLVNYLRHIVQVVN